MGRTGSGGKEGSQLKIITLQVHNGRTNSNPRRTFIGFLRSGIHPAGSVKPCRECSGSCLIRSALLWLLLGSLPLRDAFSRTRALASPSSIRASCIPHRPSARPCNFSHCIGCEKLVSPTSVQSSRASSRFKIRNGVIRDTALIWKGYTLLYCKPIRYSIYSFHLQSDPALANEPSKADARTTHATANIHSTPKPMAAN